MRFTIEKTTEKPKLLRVSRDLVKFYCLVLIPPVYETDKDELQALLVPYRLR